MASFGRRFEVTLQEGTALKCVRRGKRTDVACGDKVDVALTGPGEGVIESIHERRTLLYRADAWHEKLLAANVDQVLVVVAPEPSYSDELLTRTLVAADAAGVTPMIVLNKTDLADAAARAKESLQYYVELGYPLITLSAKQNSDALRPILQNKISLLVGQSGMGKSTLINALLPDAGARTNDISTALDSGRHTTTNARCYPLNERSAIIDSPGLQEFGLHHLSSNATEGYFREFSGLLGQCRFQDCRHQNEPGCALKAFAANNPQRETRLRYLIALQQVDRTPHY
jgi:ribosome biogenesis GTPase / thiamine phosphate phosphatase